MIKYEYSGKREKGQIGGLPVLVKEIHFNGASCNSELKHIERHSPDGFQWGYAGSGPADLALSILTHFCDKKDLLQEVAEKYYQDFKMAFIAPSGDDLKMTCREIAQWLADKDPQIEEILFEERTKNE
jgi:hypothetical protein